MRLELLYCTRNFHSQFTGPSERARPFSAPGKPGKLYHSKIREKRGSFCNPEFSHRATILCNKVHKWYHSFSKSNWVSDTCVFAGKVRGTWYANFSNAFKRFMFMILCLKLYQFIKIIHKILRNMPFRIVIP